MPRRLNTLCDLALVAGFADDRRDIEAEFLKKVVAAQGVGVESGEISEGLEPGLETEYRHSAHSRSSGSDNGLELAITELSSRLSRLEGLLLELYGHMLPVLRQLPGKPERPAAEKVPAPEASPPLTEEDAEAGPDFPASFPSEPRDPRRRWWSRM